MTDQITTKSESDRRGNLSRLLSELPFLWAIRQYWDHPRPSISFLRIEKDTFRGDMPDDDQGEVWIYGYTRSGEYVKKVTGFAGQPIAMSLLQFCAETETIEIVITVQKAPTAGGEIMHLYKLPKSQNFTDFLESIQRETEQRGLDRSPRIISISFL